MDAKKNICKNVVKTLFGEIDTIAFTCDMEATWIREDIWLVRTTNAWGIAKIIKFRALYVLNEVDLPVSM